MQEITRVCSLFTPMNITCRLYWVHDYDLIGLADSVDISIAKCAKNALIAYACGDKDYIINVPANSMVRERSNRTFHFRIDPKKPKEKQAYDIYNTFSRGVRNSAIKNMIRMYMDSANFAPYASERSAKPLTEEKQHYEKVSQAHEEAEDKPLTSVLRMCASNPGNKAADTEAESSGSEPGETKPEQFLSAASAAEEPEMLPVDQETDGLPVTQGIPLDPLVDEYQQDEDDGPNIFDWFDENLG